MINHSEAKLVLITIADHRLEDAIVMCIKCNALYYY